jgi:hypothetical protein
MGTEKPLRHEGKSLKQDVKNVPQKGGFLGRYLIILIIIGLVGIVVLSVLLLLRR